MTALTHITTSGGLISAAFIENVREAGSRQRRVKPVSFALPWSAAPKSPAALGTHLGRTDQLCFPVPGSQDLESWFPRGIGCFRTPGPYNYVHGGISLQELVVPHLRVSQQTMGRPVKVQARLPQTQALPNFADYGILRNTSAK